VKCKSLCDAGVCVCRAMAEGVCKGQCSKEYQDDDVVVGRLRAVVRYPSDLRL
jgi:hypothetical protein